MALKTIRSSLSTIAVSSSKKSPVSWVVSTSKTMMSALSSSMISSIVSSRLGASSFRVMNRPPGSLAGMARVTARRVVTLPPITTIQRTETTSSNSGVASNMVLLLG